jgi:hypothetical protein
MMIKIIKLQVMMIMRMDLMIIMMTMMMTTDTGLKEALEADLATGTLTVGRSGVDER